MDDREVTSVERLAAGLRRQADDLSLYAGMLLDLVGSALPADLVVVERQRRMLGRLRGAEQPVRAVTVTLGSSVFRLERDGVGARPVATVGHVVRGVVLSSDVLPLVPWSERLAQELARAFASDTGALDAVERLVRPQDL